MANKVFLRCQAFSACLQYIRDYQSFLITNVSLLAPATNQIA
jgi:hypothetical protein